MVLLSHDNNNNILLTVKIYNYNLYLLLNSMLLSIRWLNIIIYFYVFQFTPIESLTEFNQQYLRNKVNIKFYKTIIIIVAINMK